VWRIGAGATLTSIEEKVAAEYPSLAKMLRVFAARQIRNRATLGGNIATASPIGDSAPVLMSLDATRRAVVGQGGAHGGRWRTSSRLSADGAQARTKMIREIVLPRGGPAARLTRRVDL
jgi:CO/xanthine dehydrogenase FAD-binding subunit